MDKAIKGFTLIETMVVLMVMGIILGLGMPSFLNLMEKMGTESEAKVLAEGLRTARLVAIEGREKVVVCPSANNSTCTAGAGGSAWNGGFLIYRDKNDSKTLNNGEEILISHTFRTSITVKTESDQNQRIFYNENGWSIGSAETLLVCANVGTNENAYRVVINRAGRIKVQDWRNPAWDSNC